MGRVVLPGVTAWREFLAAGGGGILEAPPTFESSGGSPVVLVGFDDGSRLFTFANTWGSKWGENGFGRIRDTDLTRIAREGYVLDP